MADLDITAQVIDKTGPGPEARQRQHRQDFQSGSQARQGRQGRRHRCSGHRCCRRRHRYQARFSDFLSANDAIGKMSTTLSINAETLQRWNFVAGQSGAEQKDLRDGIGNLQKALGEASAMVQQPTPMLLPVSASPTQTWRTCRPEAAVRACPLKPVGSRQPGEANPAR